MIRYFAGHPTAANLLMVLLLALGLAAAPGLQRETFPEIPAREVEVRLVYPGAAASEVEAALCRRLESALEGVADLEELRCEAREGLATVTAEMREGGPIDTFFDDIKLEVDAIDDLPERVETPVVRRLGRTDFVVAVAVSGPMGAVDLKAYAEAVKDRLRADPRISLVTVRGFSDRQIRISLPALTLKQLGVSVADVAEAVRRQSVDLPGGTLETDENDILLRFVDQRRRVAEFEDLVVISSQTGAELRLGDIARITDTFELAERKVVFNGRRAAVLEVTKTRDQDTLVVMDAVRERIAEEAALAPPGVAFRLTRNISRIVRDRLNMLVGNGAVGLGLVFLTLWLFFGLRYSFWVAAGLPVAFLGAVAVMAVLGYGFDMISMVALLIAIGLLMDDAIVIAENVAVKHRAGLAPLEAAVSGTREVLPGVLSSFLTTAAVFGPLAFLSGNIGAILGVLPVVLLAVLSVSLIEAFLILPHHLGHSLRTERPARWRRRFDVGFERLRRRVWRGADWAVRHRYAVLGLAVALLMVSVALIPAGVVKFRAFPALDGDVVAARLLLPQGTPLARTEAVVGRVVAALERTDRALSGDAGQLVKNVNIRYGVNADAFESGPHLATVSVDLIDSDRRPVSADRFLAAWRAETGQPADVIALAFKQEAIGPGGLALDYRLQGTDMAELRQAADALKDWLAGYDGVRDLSDDLRPGKPELRLRLREGALALGLDARQVAGQLRAAFFGETADEIQRGVDTVEIDLRLAPADRDSLGDLTTFTLSLPDGAQVPLDAVARLEEGRGAARIHRIDGWRTVSIQGDVDDMRANAQAIVADTARRFLPQLATRFPGVQVKVEGQAREGATTGASIRRGFLLGLLGVYLLLSFQFRSYSVPLVVMTAIPMAFIGAIWGHVVLGFEMSMPSLIGVVSLSGVVVNNSILLVHFIRRRGLRGETIAHAASRAARDRFRAMLLTTLTTLAGVLPLLLETSLQAQVLKPLVTSLAFGLAASTLLVLFVLPAFYTMLEDFRRRPK